MKRGDDPARLLDGDDSAVREIVGSASGDDPSADQIAEMTARLSGLLGPHGAPPPSGAPPAEPSSSSSAVRRLLPLVVIGLVGAGAVSLWFGSPESDPEGRFERGFQQRTSANVKASIPVASAPAVETTASVRPPSSARVAADTVDELALLRRAHAAVRSGAGGKALALTQEHARLFPKSALGQEREVIAIEALVQLGRRSEAERRGERFLTGHSRSTHARRVAAILGKNLE